MNAFWAETVRGAKVWRQWISWRGIELHLWAGIVVAFLMVLLQANLFAAIAAALLVGVAHEQSQLDVFGRTFSDFRWNQPNGGTWLNGALDVLSSGIGACLLFVGLAWPLSCR